MFANRSGCCGTWPLKPSLTPLAGRGWVLQRLLLGVDLSVAVSVEHFQVVTRLLATVTPPDPMVDVPGLLFGVKSLPAHHATSLLFLPEIFDPSSTRQGVAQLPGQPLFQVEFPLWIVGVGCTPDLRPPQDFDPRGVHELNGPGLTCAITDDAREHPVSVAHLMEVFLLDPLPILLAMASMTPALQLPEDSAVHGREGALTHGITMVHGPAFDLLVQALDEVSRRHVARVVDRFLDLGQEGLDASFRGLD